jgi:transposase
MTDTLSIRITGGVDTHKDVHVAAALDQMGRNLATASFPVSASGYQDLHRWLAEFGTLDTVGIEGTSSYGAGLTRYLAESGVTVVEVNRPNRQERRNFGKSDTLDAISAARAVQAGRALGTPKSADGMVEAIRLLRVARRGAVKGRTQTALLIRDIVSTAPETLRAELTGLTTPKLAARTARLRPGPTMTPLAAAKHALSHLGRRWLYMHGEVKALDAQLAPLVAAYAPQLLALPCVGPDTAGALLVAAGDNPGRLRSEGCFAKICGVSPLPASSGRPVRHRLNQGGNREANSALWRIVLVRLRSHQPTQDYMARRTTEGLSKREIMRCLKRYVARQVFNALPRPNDACLEAAL